MKNKLTIVITTVISLLPIILSWMLYDRIPLQIAVHWNALGQADNFLDKEILLFVVPVILAIVNIVANIMSKVVYGDSKEYKSKSIVLKWICPVLSWVIITSCIIIAIK